MASEYTAKDITVLEGLEPVRRRPGMYIGGVGSAGLHRLVWEILDNSIDEAMNGHASNIAVTLHQDGSSITIADDGRGIPVDKHPTSKKSALEVIFTVLHAGGKFDHGSYKTSGGLHGVGASVVNALSKELVATVRRDGSAWEQRFRHGRPVGALKKTGAARGSGTTIFFRPDPAIFPKVEFDAATIRERLEVASYLHEGLKVVFDDESTGEKKVFAHDEGLVAYLRAVVAERAVRPVHETPFTVEKENGLRLDLALHFGHLLAHVQDDLDTGQVYAHIAREFQDHFQPLQVVVSIKPRVALAARRLQQPFALVKAQRLRVDTVLLRHG